jgi:20S proteasome subunit alpha 6
MTDFKLIAIEIKQLGWSWGAIPSSQDVDLPVDQNRESPGPVKAEADEKVSFEKDLAQPSLVSVQDGSSVDMKAEPSELASLPAKPDFGLPPVPHTGGAPAVPSPPSRVRIYFHTPVTPKDSMPIPHASAVPVDLSALATSQGSPRKGKRKRTDDEEDDDAENRTTHTSAAHQDDAVSVTTHPDQDGFRGSVAPSIGESTSEGDWLMAAIGEGSNEGDGPDSSHPPPHDSHTVNGKLHTFQTLSSSRSCGRG